MTYEEAIARLQALVEELEGGDLPLAGALERFEEGMALVKRCQSLLDEAEGKIEALLGEGESLRTEPFEPPARG